ncbi:MAG: hydroxypyruvate isomerase [Opitutaceae bacterium]|jgi:hydroxypyruvate isomerase|nr:hydroxypyruvate isomerase [Opitutaceae bacterium]
MNQSIPRRTAIKSLATGAAAVAATQAITSQASAAHHGSKLKGNINHSVCKWCYKGIELDPFCEAVKGMGLNAVDLIAIEDFPTLQKHGLSCSLVTGVPGGIKKGLNREENHETLIAWFEEVCPQISAAGYKQVICFSGNRDGMSDIQGLANCTKGLKQIVPIAEKHGVTVVMELLNSKVNHADYMADLSSWGVALCDTVGSDAFKLLYDIYHMQIMEGDVIATIRKNHEYYSHYHTGGVPGRAEIDTTQELYYPAIMEAILETGFDGYVAQEFIPAGPNPLASLEAAVQICDV